MKAKISLADLSPQTEVTFLAMDDLSESERLKGMGFLPGAKLKIEHSHKNRRIMVSIAGHQIALSFKLAQNLWVSPHE